MSVSRRRWLLPPVAVAILALLGSLALHVPAYFGLGLLEKLLESREKSAPLPPMEVEIVDSRPTDPSEATAPEPTPAEETPPAPPPEEEREREREHRREEERHAERHEEERRPEPTPVIPVPQPPAPPPPPPQEQRRTSVVQRSRDPSVPPPDDAQFLAEENNRVEEETLARIRNPNLDDPEPQPAAAEAPESPDEGDSADQEVAELHDDEGSDERDPTPEEARARPRPHPVQEPSRSPRPQVSQAAEGGGAQGGSQGAAQPREAGGGGTQARGGGSVATHEVVVHDRLGTYRIRVPNERPPGEGAGEGGGPAVAGRGRGAEGQGLASGRAGPGRRRARGGGRTGEGAPDLRVSWTQFASIYGEEELQREREAWLEQRRSRSRGESHQQRWERFRAAMEHYDVHVRPGNQTALNARADPFAAYIVSMHDRIHQRFVFGFLESPPSTVEETFRTNPDMHTVLEIAIGPDGNVARIGVVATSGNILFDFGAYNAVMTAQPFAVPPTAIRSPDGLVYMHWAFYRNDLACGTYNASPYILAHAPPPDEPGHAAARPGTLFQPSPHEHPGSSEARGSVDRP